MKGLKALGRLIGIHFAPDNHVVPVYRYGRFKRVKGPGFVFINPLTERALAPVKTSIHVGNYLFEEVMSEDNIAFEIRMTVLFTFDPATADPRAAAALLKEGESLLHIIVKDYANRGLRRLAARYPAEDLCGEHAMSAMERNLTRLLIGELRTLGLSPLRDGGVLIKETIPPDKFKRGVLNAMRFATMLQTLTGYHALGNLIQQGIQAGLMTGLEDLDSNLAFLSQMDSLNWHRTMDAAHEVPARNGYDGPNGYNGYSRR